MLNPDARAAKEKDYQAKLREFQRWGEDNQNELNQKRMEMERNIAIGLQKVIQKVGADEGFTLILENNEQIVLLHIEGDRHHRSGDQGLRCPEEIEGNDVADVRDPCSRKHFLPESFNTAIYLGGEHG